MAPTQRGWISAIVDKYMGWSGGLPWETTSYTVETVRIPVDDGVTLAADLYRPTPPPPATSATDTLLVRGPYGRDFAIAIGTARVWAARGYRVLLVSSRGTFGSGGAFEPAVTEAADGRAVVEWMRGQAWYGGGFATLGASYLGFTQWTLLSGPDGPPPDMRAAVINTGLHDFDAYAWGSGAFKAVLIFWAAFMHKLLSGRAGPMPLMLRSLNREVPPVYDGVPLLDAVDAYFEGAAPSYIRDLVTRTDPDGRLAASMHQESSLGQTKVPILLTTGWYDVLKEQVMEQYETLSERGCNVALTIGPWTHLGAGGSNTMRETWAWLGEHGGGRAEPFRCAPIRAFITGAREWRDLEKWPPATTPREFYLSTGGQLSEEKPAGASESSFEFNPALPTPAVGGPGQFALSPEDEDTALAARDDVLTFTTKALDETVEVLGKPVVELHHATSTPFADLLVRISEVDARGTSRHITESYVRLDDKRPPGPLRIEIPDCGHRFVQGSRVRLLVAGGAHPRYIRNFGTGEPEGRETTMVPVQHTVYHHGPAVSTVTLPVRAA